MLIWRGLITLLLAVLVYGMFQPNLDVGTEPAWWYLLCGLLPSVVVVALLIWRPVVGFKAAIVHDVFIAVGFAALALFLVLSRNSFFGLVLLLWLAVFPLEGLFLWVRGRLKGRR